MTGSQAILECLLKEGVDTIFGYPGGAIMPLYDALYDYKEKIRHILVRHEQGASHAAEGYARLTGKPGVCIVTSGPGATNLVTGITDAMIDSVPMVCITGQVASQVLGTDAFQEADIIGITTPITKWCYQVTQASEIPEVIAKAFKIANNGRPGPVVVDITKSAQFDEFDFEYPEKVDVQGLRLTPTPKDEDIKKAAELLNNSKSPYVIVGHGVLISKAEEEVKELIEIGGFPVASTLHGLSSINSDHPLYMGMMGMHGNYATNKLVNKADVVLAIGMRFDDRVTGKVSEFVKNAKVIHIEVDKAEINKIIKTDVAVHSDAKSALKKLIPLIKKSDHSKWIKEFETLEKQENIQVKQKELYPTGRKIRMAEVIRLVNEKTFSNAVIVADVGQHQMIAARYSTFKNTDSYITSGGLGTMGFALPASIGAKIAKPEREVVAIIGDGCFQMTIQELGTITQEKLPIKIIILNNNFLGMVRQWQELFFEKRYSFVHLENPDFIQVAKGFYIEGQKVTERENLSEALDEMFAFNGPYVLDIHVEREGNVFPMVPTGASVDEVRLS